MGLFYIGKVILLTGGAGYILKVVHKVNQLVDDIKQFLPKKTTKSFDGIVNNSLL